MPPGPAAVPSPDGTCMEEEEGVEIDGIDPDP
jgi:hypothetical protein